MADTQITATITQAPEITVSLDQPPAIVPTIVAQGPQGVPGAGYVPGGTTDNIVTIALDDSIKDSGIAITTIPTKATGTEVDTGTDDEKFITAKAIEDSTYIKSTGNAATATALATARAINGVDFNGTAAITIPDIILTTAPDSDHIATGMKITLTAGSNVNFGDVCYIASTGKATIIDADAIASMSGVVMALDTISADASGTFLLMGIARDDTWNWTVGGIIYGTVTGTTGNTLSQTAPSGTDDVVQIMGVATHQNRIFFNPQLVQVELV